MNPIRILRKKLLAFHRDTRGAIAILVLLTIWCLLAILGLVWNTIEEARQRTAAQAAADSAAHAAGVWMARTGNTINAQNMVICQDASAESLWRAITGTGENLRPGVRFRSMDQILTDRFNLEIQTANDMMKGQALDNARKQLEARLAQIASDYQLTADALGNLSTGTGANFASPDERTLFMNQLRQADSARNWVMNTYVGGAAPKVLDPMAPPRPGPPGPSGEGLAQIVAKWQPTANENAILQYIINFILTTEMPYQTRYDAQTAFAKSVNVPSNMAAHEDSIFQAQVGELESLALTIEQQRQQLADFYHFDITLATLKNSPGNKGPAAVTAPYVPGYSVPPVPGFTDSIRGTQITINALSPHSDLSNITADGADNATIWHPDGLAAVPPGILSLYPSLRPAYPVPANLVPGGWGHAFAMPLERYFLQRVNSDLQQISETYMIPLDDQRSGPLAQQIRRMLGTPNNGNIRITVLPSTIPDDQPEPVLPGPPLPPGQTPPPPPPPRYDQIYVLPRITAPANATVQYRNQVQLYNTNGARFTADVRELRWAIIRYTELFDLFTERFAQQAWETDVNSAAAMVAQALGHDGKFMVLSTYGLRNIPNWAVPGMYDSAGTTIEDAILSATMPGLVQAISDAMAAGGPGGPGGGILDQFTAVGAYGGQAAQLADAILRPVAHQIAVDLAAEWVRRPWAYEITPPPTPVPPSRGVLPYERKTEFTVLAAARQTAVTAPRLVLQDIFGGDTTPLVAYAQAEMFNWMEFNDVYGTQPYDQVIEVPELVYWWQNSIHHNYVGAPRGWRVASPGGWEWRSRLSLSDAMTPFTNPVTGVTYDAIQQNAEFRQYLQDSGISNFDSGAINAINLH